MFEYGFSMKLYVMVVVLGLAATTLSVAIPKPDEDHKNRVIDKELSNQDHFGDDEEHNPEYDHEAFLGKDEARSFEDLTPEQSQERLAKIYDKIDKDADKFVTQDELREWIKYVQNKYIHEDTERQWKEHSIEDGKLSWEHYKSRTYGNVDEDAKEDDDDYNYKDMVRRDKRRWEKADGDNDGSLTQEEFAFFLHPEEAEHMREIVVEETLEDIDKDKDGLISMEEYIGDIYPGGDDEDEERPEWVQTEKDQFMTQRDKDGDGFLDHNEILQWILPEDYDHIHAEVEHLLREADTDQDMWPNREDNEDEPDWVKTERDQFATFRDKNKDGVMDKAEVTDWIIPADYDHSEAEAKHLILESDGDRDGKLSKEEVVAKYDLFVGSQATDFGEALARHDEF